MKYIRFQFDNLIYNGLIKDDEITVIEGDFWDDFEITVQKFNLNEVKILAPVKPSKIVCVGLNYKDHAKELKLQIPSNPILFIKPNSSLLNPNEEIIIPNQSKRVDYEGELAFVIKKRAKNVKAKDYKDYILGYTCLNDVTARDLQNKDGQWTRAKSFDTFCPFGPIITDETEPFSLDIKTIVNGKIAQNSNTNQFIFDVPYLLEFISECMTMEAGDIVSTGTPSGIGKLNSGDCVEIVIENVGVLKNFVK